MYLKAFSQQGVRNLSQGKLELASGLNIFYGDNGAGKSSILEAIVFSTTGRSFRTSKLELMVSEGESIFVVFGLSSEERRVGIRYDKKTKLRTIKINGENINNLSGLNTIYPTQILSPESYHLIDSGPSERRKYLDWCLFHVKHSYHSAWKSYTNILKQRNALLKNKNRSRVEEQIPIWDQQLCTAAEIVNKERMSILTQLEKQLKSTIAILDVSFCDSLKINYYPGYTDELADKLRLSLSSDMDSGFTKFGPHKADIRIKVNGYLAKDYLSRGQKKVLINAMFLAQTLLLKESSHKGSLFVIDDFTSELDNNNQKALLDMLMAQDSVQIVLSCLQQDSLKWLEKGYNSAHMFHVEHGTISSISQ
jgi:DNA replication and repair protein RecF